MSALLLHPGVVKFTLKQQEAMVSFMFEHANLDNHAFERESRLRNSREALARPSKRFRDVVKKIL